MAIKSKNIKYSRIFKVCALALAFLTFFLAGNFAGLFIRGFANYNVFTNPADFTNTTSFRAQMNPYIRSVIALGMSEEYRTFEEYKESEQAKAISEGYCQMMTDTENAHKLLEESDIEIYIDAQNRYRYALTHNNTRYYFSYDGSMISADDFSSFDYVNQPGYTESTTAEVSIQSEAADGTTDVTAVTEIYNRDGVADYDPYQAGNTPAYIQQISDALSSLNVISNNTCYGEMPLKNMLELIEERRIAYLADTYTWNSQGEVYDITESVKGVKYAVIYKNSGAVFTNCGVAEGDTQSQIIEKFGDIQWAECVENGKYKLLKGEKTRNPDGVYASLHSALFGEGEARISVLDSYRFDDVERAYFALPESIPSSSNFAVLQKSFDSYGAHSLTALLVMSLVCFVIACAACIYLFAVTGKTADGIRINFFDKIPFELSCAAVLTVTAVAAVLLPMLVIFDFNPLFASPHHEAYRIVKSLINACSSYFNLITGVCVMLFFGLWTLLNMSIFRNIRNKSFIRHTLFYWVTRPLVLLVKLLWKLSRKLFERIRFIIVRDYSKGNGNKFRILSCIAVLLILFATPCYYGLVTFFVIVGLVDTIPPMFVFGILLLIAGFIGDMLILGVFLLFFASLSRIMAAVSDMRKGKLEGKINKKFMTPMMRLFADDVLGVRDGLQNAVESAVKDQRMKAELITNVSHDLKTPLTSIVTYVDLLKKCKIDDEDALKYISVLDEKSHRMKTLIEDLVEASKASSGAMEIHRVKLNLCEFAAQAVGEHEDEMKELGIEFVLRTPAEPVIVFADAQKTSRVAENLFSNIRKYALEGTRVYMEVSKKQGCGEITIKNISKHPLNVSSEELMQRFVRGDASRSGEGSGLGLSIAKDLCELQGGSLTLQVDGDLFKAMITLPET